MPTPALTREWVEPLIAAVEKYLERGYRPMGMPGQGPGAVVATAVELGIPDKTIYNQLRAAKDRWGLEPDWSKWKDPRIPTEDFITSPDEVEVDYHGVIRDAMAAGEPTIDELVGRTKLPPEIVKAIILSLETKGANVQELGGHYTLAKAVEPSYIHGPYLEVESNDDHAFKFGVISDTHLGSKYERLDVLNWEYDRFADAGVSHVFHAGNWIEGEARFNRFDIHVYGMDNQCQYLAEHYPQREGITTYAVSGDDHEGWYAQREGVDIGRYAERVMRDRGREDWVNLGYMEAHVALVNKETRKASVMAVVHPGGGSSYADSYTVQKIIESLAGGEKPGVAIYGHYHKHLAGRYRNVWWLQAGCTKDQDPFARKKKLRYDVGGTLLTLQQDPQMGVIEGFLPDMRGYFNVGYYQGRWSHHGKIQLPERKWK